MYNYFGDLPSYGSGYVLFYERSDFDPALYDLSKSKSASSAETTSTRMNSTAAAAAIHSSSIPLTTFNGDTLSNGISEDASSNTTVSTPSSQAINTPDNKVTTNQSTPLSINTSNNDHKHSNEGQKIQNPLSLLLKPGNSKTQPVNSVNRDANQSEVLPHQQQPTVDPPTLPPSSSRVTSLPFPSPSAPSISRYKSWLGMHKKSK